MVDFQFFDSSESEKFSEIWNQISELRYRVYSDELKQYENNQQQVLVDPGKYFITCLDNQKLIGYVSLNPHSTSGFRISKYFSDEIMYENKNIRAFFGWPLRYTCIRKGHPKNAIYFQPASQI